MRERCDICGCPKAAEWVSIDAAAQALGTVPQAVETLCSRGKLRGRRQDRRWIVQHASLDRLLESYEAEP